MRLLPLKMKCPFKLKNKFKNSSPNLSLKSLRNSKIMFNLTFKSNKQEWPHNKLVRKHLRCKLALDLLIKILPLKINKPNKPLNKLNLSKTNKPMFKLLNLLKNNKINWKNRFWILPKVKLLRLKTSTTKIWTKTTKIKNNSLKNLETATLNLEITTNYFELVEIPLVPMILTLNFTKFLQSW